MLGTIKIDVAFGSQDGDFLLRRMKIEAGIRYTVPAEDDSWQLAAGKDQVLVQGTVIINYDGGCPAPVFDKESNKTFPVPMILGRATIDLALGDKGSPIEVQVRRCKLTLA